MAKQEGEKKEGVTVKEIENFGKKYRFQIFFCLSFILASFFSFIFYGVGWSIYLAGLGAIVAIWIPTKIGRAAHATLRFCFKQEKVTRIIIACVGIIVSIFLAPLIFLCIGLMAGRGFHRHGLESMENLPENKNDHHSDHH
jgi:uncharacterized membrane protein